MTLHELCEAYRSGDRWYACGVNDDQPTTTRGPRQAADHVRSLHPGWNDYDPYNEPAGSGAGVTQLREEIAGRVIGHHAIGPDNPVFPNEINLGDEFDDGGLTALDMVTIGRAFAAGLS